MLRYVEAQQSKKNCIFSFHCACLALSLHKIGCDSAMKIKNAFFLFIALALHYLCTHNDK